MNGFVARKGITHALGMNDKINADTISKFDFLRNTANLVKLAPNVPRSKQKIRTLKLKPRPLYEALQETRSFHESEEGKTLYRKRAGVERYHFPGASELLDCAAPDIEAWPKLIYSTLPRQRPSILNVWLLGLMGFQEGKQGSRDLRLWHQFDFANRIRPFVTQFCGVERTGQKHPKSA